MGSMWTKSSMWLGGLGGLCRVRALGGVGGLGGVYGSRWRRKSR